MSELLLLGISHHEAPVELREKVALPPTDAVVLCRDLVATQVVEEAVAISTCNRTEVYLVSNDPVLAETELLARLALRGGFRPTELASVVYAPRNCDAARHLYRVTSGLESMIVGEAEVQGQVRRAFEAARTAGTTGALTHRLFTAALQTGGRVRAETALGEGRASVSSVAVALAREAVGDLAQRRVVLIGAGETSELTARALAEQGARSVFVANRHADRARSIAARFGGHVSSLHELPERIAEADVVVTGTASPHPIIHVEALAEIVAGRDRPLVLIDIAVPRDVEAACAELPGVTLYDVDDMQAVIARNLEVRQAERVRAEGIVEDEIQRFARWLGQLEVLPTVAELREHGSAIVEQVLAENARRWETAADRERAEAVARAVMQRLLHEPTVRLKGMGRGAGHGRLQLVRELFGLEEGVPATPEQDAPGEVRELPRRRREPGS